MSKYHLAQVNVARMLAPIDSAVMAGFVARLDEINALAERTEGFVWRLKGEDNNATALRVFDDDMLIINMSVWESIDALFQYTYYTAHAEVFRQRRDWFSKLNKPHMALWWIKAGTTPTPQDAKDKLAYMDRHGISPLSFTFKQRYSIEDMQRALNEISSTL